MNESQVQVESGRGNLQGEQGKLLPSLATWPLSQTMAGRTWRKEAGKHEQAPMTTTN